MKLFHASFPWSGLGQETTNFFKNNLLQTLHIKRGQADTSETENWHLQRKLFTVSVCRAQITVWDDVFQQ